MKIIKQRYLVEVYKVGFPTNKKIRDDITEATEDFLNKTRDFQYQLQGDNLKQIANRLLKLKL